MLKHTRELMIVHAQTLKPSSDRAKCYQISGYALVQNETIAERLEREHSSSSDGHLRDADIMVQAGCASMSGGKKYCYGKFTFEDGSTFKSQCLTTWFIF